MPGIPVRTPLGDDVFVLRSLSGTEKVSRLFDFRLDLVSDRTRSVPFEALLGAPMSVTLPDARGPGRRFSGICAQLTQGRTGPDLTTYRAEVVPPLALLRLRTDTRIFQRRSVPEIVRLVLGGTAPLLDLRGTYHPREYTVQYGESDFDFVSRLMEDEGIHYYFRDSADPPQPVLGDTADAHPPLPGTEVLRYSATPAPGVVFQWDTTQRLVPRKYVSRDYHVQLPGDAIEHEQTIQDSVMVGAVTHHLTVGNAGLDVYEWPGGAAERYDGVGPAREDQSAELAKVHPEAQRLAGVRMQEQAVGALEVSGASGCRNLVAGHRLSLAGHSAYDGQYVLTSVSHRYSVAGDPRSAGKTEVQYDNTFTCIPAALPFRPQRTTPRPTVHGTHLAVVVGPPGERTYSDTYGRVKVQFHWDREGRRDENSSCWVRVATPSGGAPFVPVIGQEVVVDFLEGDIERPVVLGALFNGTDQPPPPSGG